MTLYSSPLYQGRKRLRLIQRIIKAAATLLLFAFVPLTKDIALADVANNRSSMAAAGEPRALAQERVVPPSGSKGADRPPQAEVKQGQKATFTSDSVATPTFQLSACSGTGAVRVDRTLVVTASLWTRQCCGRPPMK